MAKYYENLGECVPDNLIAGNDIPLVTESGSIRSGQGALKRGTVLALSTGSTGDGKLVILGTTATPTTETLTAYGILADDVDATTGAVAEVYVTGQFNRDALIVKSEYTIKTEDIVALRDGGILVENIMGEIKEED